MEKQRAIALLSQSKPELQARFGVTRLALFGSTARDDADSDNDVDIMLEDLFNCPNDLVTEKALRAEFRPYIERERVNV